jgi:hypothetical protein
MYTRPTKNGMLPDVIFANGHLVGSPNTGWLFLSLWFCQHLAISMRFADEVIGQAFMSFLIILAPFGPSVDLI